jgi:hypothetical protein
MSPWAAISAGLVALGLGAKLQRLIHLAELFGFPAGNLAPASVELPSSRPGSFTLEPARQAPGTGEGVKIGAPWLATLAAVALTLAFAACTQEQIDASSRAACEIARAEARASANSPSAGVRVAVAGVEAVCAMPEATGGMIYSALAALRGAKKAGA